MNTFNIAGSGLRANIAQQATSAHNIANANTDGFARQRTTQSAEQTGGVSARVDTVSLSPEAQMQSETVAGAQNNVNVANEMVKQIETRENFKQNAQTVRAQDNMQKTLLDTFA